MKKGKFLIFVLLVGLLLAFGMVLASCDDGVGPSDEDYADSKNPSGGLYTGHTSGPGYEVVVGNGEAPDDSIVDDLPVFNYGGGGYDGGSSDARP